VIRAGSRPVIHATSRALPVGRARTALVLGAVVASLALSGCAAGQVAQTAYQANSATGATANVGAIAIRDAQIAFGGSAKGAAVYPAGGSAPLEMHVINTGQQGDRLVSASSPVASAVQIVGESDLPGGTEMVVGGGTGTGGQTLGGPSEPGASPSAAPTAEPAPAAGDTPVPQPTVGATAPAGGDAPPAGLQPPPTVPGLSPSTRYADIVLTGLQEDVQAGLSYPLVLNFEKAGQVHVMLPVGYRAQPREAAEHE
jgi:copper(I)-binding protein